MLRSMLGCLLACVAGTVSAQADDPRPINRFAAATAQQLRAGDFAALERLAASLHARPQVLSDGQPTLGAFYAGVSKCVESRCGDERMAPEDWVAHRRLLEKWEAAYPDSVTAKTAIALFWKEYAWLARGLDYADTVSDDQWAIFNSRLQKSRQLLEALRTRKDVDAAWYDGLLSIANAQGRRGSGFDQLYKEATMRFPDYLPFYFTKAAHLSPRWGGTQQDFARYVDDVVASTSRQMGETMYARLNWSSSSSTMFVDGQADWSRMKHGFERLTHDYPDRWNINAYAKFACVAHDAGTLKQQLSRIDQAPALAVWGSRGFYSHCLAIAGVGSR